MTPPDEVLRQTRLILEDGGERSELGCSGDDAESAKAYVRKNLPHKPYCVVKDWVWVEVEVPAVQRKAFAEEGVNPVFIFAKSVVEDEAQRPHVGPMVKTSLLVKLHEQCVFETENTAYVLCGPGRTVTVGVLAANNLHF